MEFMEQEKISGTIMLCPSVAEELLGGSAYMVREGVFIGFDLRVRHAACRQGRRRLTGRPGPIPTLH